MGATVGTELGWLLPDGLMLGEMVGLDVVGLALGETVGKAVGLLVGFMVGPGVGLRVGPGVGFGVC